MRDSLLEGGLQQLSTEMKRQNTPRENNKAAMNEIKKEKHHDAHRGVFPADKRLLQGTEGRENTNEERFMLT